ncbi:hypothetical protein A2V56_04365 [Candidatus Woesebacteria bacterium RBG_19FT_COMBO_42_9]|uniref:AI-2E family transporter n=1 Tax=Candidatus Woesebacteria bacterium RBG_16_42_24 TaxID=1802485 RepID=A0A1F7XME6_9BACT|nr:MAG: hypothetical protein A2V97_04355 [Candidatus Woesebacteria bacterium RBG_16_42_24]OGM16202.1 MAG: hypothetical protein A2V56_04365 [Candidatus Woesebacteria bacterium RBG_19FT_COMBO_42_9]OGM66864.1 MAG: hypothetical protein A2985_01805 [Candidatus Woesebacteria bacterium RIFCSPLOWO2_01_FULL_43_11]
MPRKIEISHRTIVFMVLFLLFLWLLYLIRDIILEFFVALLIMAILDPTVTRFSRFKIPRAISVLVVYILSIGLISLTIGAIIPPLVEQTAAFAVGLPKYLANLGVSRFVSDEIVRQLLNQIGIIPAQALKIGISIFSNVLGVLTVLILAFYLLLTRDKLDEALGFFFGDDRRKEAIKLVDVLEQKLGGWARGELALMVLVGVSTYFGLILLGIPFALPLALLAGLLEIVPYVGPIISAIPSVIIGLGISPIIGLATAALYFLIQQVENYVFVPKVMEKSVGVSPIITLLALAVGFRLAGVVGIVMSVPVVISIQVIVARYLLTKE